MLFDAKARVRQFVRDQQGVELDGMLVVYRDLGRFRRIRDAEHVASGLAPLLSLFEPGSHACPHDAW